MQDLKEEPPMGVKCKDKFLIQSTVMTPEKETLALPALVRTPSLAPCFESSLDGSRHGVYLQWNPEGTITEDRKVHQQKLKVTYLPADGQDIAKEHAAGRLTARRDPALCKYRQEKTADAHAHTAAKGKSAGWRRFIAGLKWGIGCDWLGMTRKQMYQKFR